MTKQEFVDKYGDVKVRFSRYYKYVFTFRADLGDGKTLTCDIGGGADDIYKVEVVPDCDETVAGLDPLAGSVWKDHKQIEGYYDY